MDQICGEVVENLLLHAPPVHEARVDQRGIFARTITFTDREVDYWTRKEELYRVIRGTEEYAICNL